MKTTRGIRNCNPCNIRLLHDEWIGMADFQTDKEFVQFKSMKYGLRAVWKLMRVYCNHHDCDTITRVISRWAPPTENATDKYIEHVSKRTGIQPNEQLGLIHLNHRKWASIIRAMCIIESGYDPTEEELVEAYNMAFGTGFRIADF